MKGLGRVGKPTIKTQKPSIKFHPTPKKNRSTTEEKRNDESNKPIKTHSLDIILISTFMEITFSIGSLISIQIKILLIIPNPISLDKRAL